MKKHLATLALLITISLTPVKAHAFYLVEDPIAIGKLVLTYGKEVLTAYNTGYLQLKAAMAPFANAMIAASLLKQQNNTLNLVTASLGGGDSLLKQDPEKWIQQQGIDTVRLSLANLNNPAGTGIYSNSLLGSVTATFKAQNSSLQTKVNLATQSSIPQTIQNNLCTDAKLNDIAKNDVMHSDGTYDPAEFNARKQYLWNNLCVGSPNPSSDPAQNAKNMALAKRLTQAYNQRPDIGGWDTWLAITGGDNPYAQSVKLTTQIDQAAQASKDSARADLAQGGGIASPRSCTSRLKYDQNGDPVWNITDGICQSYKLTGSSEAVKSAYQEALNSGVDRLKASFGSDILDSLGSLLSARNTLNLLGNAFTSLGSSGGGSNQGTTNSSASLTPDLTSDTKASLTEPISFQIDTYLKSLDSLTQMDGNIVREINLEETNLDSMNVCYQNAISSSAANGTNLTSSSPQVAPALAYYTSQKTYLEGIRASVSSDQSEIASAKDYIGQIQTTIQSSNSSAQINDAFATFQEKINNGTFPSDSAASTREADYTKIQGENQDYSNQTGGLYNYYQMCQSLSGRTSGQ